MIMTKLILSQEAAALTYMTAASSSPCFKTPCGTPTNGKKTLKSTLPTALRM